MLASAGLEEHSLTFNRSRFFGLDRQVRTNLSAVMMLGFQSQALAEDEQTVPGDRRSVLCFCSLS